MQKFSHEYVNRYFLEQNCTLLSTYTNIKTKLDYICSCGNQSSITFGNFKQGNRCKICGRRKTTAAQSFDIEYVKNIFIANECVPLFEVYHGVHKPLSYICKCGNPAKITLSDFKNGKRCKSCGNNKRNKSQSHDIDFVCNFFNDNNCTLLSSEYLNAKQKLDYICECGNVSSICFDKFRIGQRCQNCKLAKISKANTGRKMPSMKGSNNPRYNPNLTDEERIIKRSYQEYWNWRDSVFKRDNYTCYVCSIKGSGTLNAHHLDGYSWCVEKRTDLDNGVTLCRKCHKDFHDEYGWKNNTREQFVEYYKSRRD